MNACKLAEIPLIFTKNAINGQLGDLSDADLLLRPAEGANHIAWQLGHLILSEQRAGRHLAGAKYPELPAGFVEKHDRQPTAQNATSGFGSKAQYLELFNKTRETTLAALAKLSEADLDRPVSTPVPGITNLGGVFSLIAMHTLMHGGQFSVIRRKLGKPVLF